MASSPDSLFTVGFPPVTKEEFNSFHSIDRDLYSRLINKLGRNPSESTRVMGLWLWLEQECSDLTLVKRLSALPLNLLHEVADETVTCLTCVESDTFFLDGTELCFLPKFLQRGITLKYFHENRIRVLRGITKNVKKVCVRAFEDIVQQPFVGHVFSPLLPGPSEAPGNVNLGVRMPMLPRANGTGVFVSPFLTVPSNPSNVGVVNAPQNLPPGPSMLPSIFHPQTHTVAVGNVQTYDTRAQPRRIVNNDFAEMFNSQVRIEEDRDVSPDDRTIFLTFSKGYPISENEVRDFFTRKFGDFIEDVYMQEVSPDEQPLYARMVSKSLPIIDVIIEGDRAKYSINGKHVWARKYIRN